MRQQHTCRRMPFFINRAAKHGWRCDEDGDTRNSMLGQALLGAAWRARSGRPDTARVGDFFGADAMRGTWLPPCDCDTRPGSSVHSPRCTPNRFRGGTRAEQGNRRGPHHWRFSTAGPPPTAPPLVLEEATCVQPSHHRALATRDQRSSVQPGKGCDHRDT